MESQVGEPVTTPENNDAVSDSQLKRKAPEQEEQKDQEQNTEQGTPKKQKVEGETQAAGEAEREWYYIDDQQKEQGPFTLQEMQSWWFGGYMPATLTVRRKNETEFVSITSIPEFQQPSYTDPSAYYAYYYQTAYANATPGTTPTTSTPTVDPTAAHAPAATIDQVYPGFVYAPVDRSDDDRIAAKLLCSTYSQSAAFNKRTGRFSSLDGGYTDSASRQMAHYFDYEAWQRQCQENAQKKVKRVCPKHMWKQYRKKKKIPDYLKD